MSVLKEAFKLLRDYSSITPSQKQKRIARVDQLLKSAEKRKKRSICALRDIDQLRKQRAYLLIMGGYVDEGIKEIESLVADYNETICELHDEAAFQLAEAAVASFRRRSSKVGEVLACSALSHAGLAMRINRTVLTALELMQRTQTKGNLNIQGSMNQAKEKKPRQQPRK